MENKMHAGSTLGYTCQCHDACLGFNLSPKPRSPVKFLTALGGVLCASFGFRVLGLRLGSAVFENATGAGIHRASSRNPRNSNLHLATTSFAHN